MSTKIGIAQLNPTVGAIEENLQSIREYAVESEDAEMVVFPELSLIGYPPMDMLHHMEFIEHQEEALDELRELTEDDNIPTIVVGVALEEGGFLRNMAVVIKDGRFTCRYAKRLLPTYDVFDEHRYFEPGDSSCSFNLNGLTVGISVCEDAWWDTMVQGRPQHTMNPMAEFSDMDVYLVVNLSASPFHVGKQSHRVERFIGHAESAGAPVVFANQVGGNDELLFDGGSFIVNKDGVMGEMSQFEEKYKEFSLEAEITGFDPLSEVSQLHQSLVMGIRDYFNKTGFDQAVIGLSGGIDSSVTAVLATEALEPRNVYGVSLPSSVTSEGKCPRCTKVG